jgi:Ser-tRNA(Ala) deacylase AlaX
MKPNSGPLQTGEHILAKIIETKFSDAKVGIAKFSEESGILEILTQSDLRTIDIPLLQDEVNEIIARDLPVKKTVMPRADAEKIVDLRKVPPCIELIRVVEIGDFDKRPCKDPHVDNTKDIGKFIILGVERVGNGRYRFSFTTD